MRVIDCHVHLYPDELNRDPIGWAVLHREAEWAGLCTRRRRDGMMVQDFPGVDELLREMDAAGVDRAVLLGWYWRRPESCAAQNRFYAECVRAHPARLSAFATIQPGGASPAAVAEAMRRARDEGLVGLGELSPHAQGYAVDNPGLRAALALAADWRWPVNLHVTDPNSRLYPGRVETPLEDFERLAREWPRVNFVLAHWGGLLPLRNVAAQALPNVFYDTAASPLVYDSSVWKRFLATVPEEKILFGSDFPLNLYPKVDATATMSRFIAEAAAGGASARVMRDNAAELLGRRE
ncbi:MAG TPA: amidohydrolase family protein [Opitutus sp.]|nr:amidohydrolase family protein [Opitutus sp.]